MSRLYEISNEFKELFDRFDDISEIEFEKNENGEYIDNDGNVIDPEQVKADLMEAWFTTCSDIEEEFGAKAENIAVYIKNIKAMTEAIRAEQKALVARRAALERKAERMTEYLLHCMDDMGLKKLDTVKAKLSVRSNAESALIKDEHAFISWAQENDMDDLLRYADPEISKTAVKALLKEGTNLPYAELTKTRSLIIK